MTCEWLQLTFNGDKLSNLVQCTFFMIWQSEFNCALSITLWSWNCFLVISWVKKQWGKYKPNWYLHQWLKKLDRTWQYIHYIISFACNYPLQNGKENYIVFISYWFCSAGDITINYASAIGSMDYYMWKWKIISNLFDVNFIQGGIYDLSYMILLFIQVSMLHVAWRSPLYLVMVRDK